METATPDHLLGLSEAEFLDLVLAEARGRVEIPALRDPLIVDRWHNTLVGKKRDLERQLGSKRMRLKALRTTKASRDQIDREAQSYATWRTNVLELLRRLEGRITEARGLRLTAQAVERQ